MADERPAAFRAAIVGRPNVGKSTLFNRLVGRRIALVDDRPGVTRDRREGEARLADLRFTVIDTAGLEDADDATLQGRMRMQTEAAILDADVTLFMIDARAGVTPDDAHFARLIRTADKPVVLIANKAEGRAAESGFLEAWSLGLGEPVPISAEHGEGLADLLDALLPFAPPEEVDHGAATDEDGAAEAPDRPMQIAVVGRPNVGKSTLVNRLLGEDRMLTGPEAGITRDAIAVDLVHRAGGKERAFRLFDTAGMRRRARVIDKVEKLSVGDTLRAIRFAEVVVLMMAADEPFEKQDLQIADLVEREGRALVLALNKWDQVAEPQARLAELSADLKETLAQLRGVALVPVSARTGTGLDRLMAAVVAAHTVWNRRIATARLNTWLAAATARHPPPAVSGRRIRLKYLSQTKTRPPTFYLSCSRPEALADSYRRFLVNALRDDFDLPGTPIRLMLRAERNPYDRKKKR